jgi:hypothetical protein
MPLVGHAVAFMDSPDPKQLEIDFEAPGSEVGLNEWHEQRRAAMRQLACSLGLPLGHQVEVWLSGSVRLRGRLRLHEAGLFIDQSRDASLELCVDGVPFKVSEIESCVRLD